ncbi:calmodulin-like protein 5 [Camellia sinensis]|uniref:calmodulin-like protein 5 n=1 Tax=Camellia sinensis TaxID=4442 RepID=UPI0010367D0E|nr:calmodulin-like protein 5 [Camellia sinensis]
MPIYEVKAFWDEYEVKAFNQPLNEEELKGIFKKHDKNGNGRLSRKELKKTFEELGAWIPDWRALRDFATQMPMLKGIFKKHDKNGDGRLSRKELKKAFEELGAWIPDWRAWRGLSNADANGDGFISEEEMNSLVLYAMRFGYTVK